MTGLRDTGKSALTTHACPSPETCCVVRIEPACYCGDLSWTVKAYGRELHKHGCPVRNEPVCQAHPSGCPDD